MSPFRTTTYGYDADDDLQSITYRDGVTPNVSYTYSPTDQRLSMADGTGTTSYSYDDRDRLVSLTNGGSRRMCATRWTSSPAIARRAAPSPPA